jgi:hypothetical protein
VVIEEQYRNMREVLDKHPRVVDYAREAIRRAGMEVRERSIRGGTDGSKLSFMGLPTPNIFAGEHNFHSRLEWVSAQDMEKAVEVIVNLARSGKSARDLSSAQQFRGYLDNTRPVRHRRRRSSCNECGSIWRRGTNLSGCTGRGIIASLRAC